MVAERLEAAQDIAVARDEAATALLDVAQRTKPVVFEVKEPFGVIERLLSPRRDDRLYAGEGHPADLALSADLVHEAVGGPHRQRISFSVRLRRALPVKERSRMRLVRGRFAPAKARELLGPAQAFFTQRPIVDRPAKQHPLGTEFLSQFLSRSRFRVVELACKSLENLVGVRGFESPAPASRKRCSTRLSYTPPTEGEI